MLFNFDAVSQEKAAQTQPSPGELVFKMLSDLDCEFKDVKLEFFYEDTNQPELYFKSRSFTLHDRSWELLVDVKVTLLALHFHKFTLLKFLRLRDRLKKVKRTVGICLNFKKSRYFGRN